MKREDARPLLPVIVTGPDMFHKTGPEVLGTIYVIDDEHPSDIDRDSVFCRVPEFVAPDFPFGWWFPYSSIEPLDEGIANLIDIVPRRKT